MILLNMLPQFESGVYLRTITLKSLYFLIDFGSQLSVLSIHQLLFDSLAYKTSSPPPPKKIIWKPIYNNLPAYALKFLFSLRGDKKGLYESEVIFTNCWKSFVKLSHLLTESPLPFLVRIKPNTTCLIRKMN